MTEEELLKPFVKELSELDFVGEKDNKRIFRMKPIIINGEVIPTGLPILVVIEDGKAYKVYGMESFRLLNAIYGEGTE